MCSTGDCSYFAAGNVTASKDCCGKVMDFCCCTKGLITEKFQWLRNETESRFLTLTFFFYLISNLCELFFIILFSALLDAATSTEISSSPVNNFVTQVAKKISPACSVLTAFMIFLV